MHMQVITSQCERSENCLFVCLFVSISYLEVFFSLHRIGIHQRERELMINNIFSSRFYFSLSTEYSLGELNVSRFFYIPLSSSCANLSFRCISSSSSFFSRNIALLLV